MMQAVRHTLLAYEPEDEAARPLVLPVREAEAAMGETVEAFLRRVAWHFDLPTVCRINGVYYARDEWGLTHFCANDNIEFLSRPLGGAGGGGNSAAKSIGAIVALVALTAIAPYVVAGLGGLIGAGAAVGTVGALTATGQIASALLVGGGSLAISHFLKPKPAAKTAAKNDLYSFAFGGNAARPLEPIPEWFGRNLAHPDYAAPRYSEYIGDSMIEYALLCVGRGKYDIEELRIANTTIWTKANGVSSGFPGLQVAFYGPGEQVTLFPVNVVTSSEVAGIQLTGTTYVGGFVANAAGTTTKELLIDLVWPGGSYVSYKDRILPPQTGITIEGVQVDQSGVEQGSYQTLLTRAYSFAKQSQIRVTERITVSEGRWKVRIRRTNPPISGGLGAGQSGTDDVVWSALRAHLEGPQVYDRVTTIAIKASANASLAGFTNGQLGVIATRILPTWSAATSQFVEVPTRSIAWAAMYMWRDAYNGNQSLTQVDFQSFLDYDALWTSLGHTFDFIFKSPMALDEAMETILRAGRAYPAHIGDQISIVRDEPRGIPRMLFTDYDIVRGSLEIDYSLANQELADGMIGEYIEETTHKLAEVSSAPDGVVLAKPKRVQLNGASKRTQAAGLIRFQAAETQYRRITASWTARAEGRSLKRGDLVLLSCEEPETWGQSCEVLAYDDPNRTLTLDPAPVWNATGLHYVEVRRRDGQPWGPVRVTRGASDALAIVDATDFTTESTRQGMALFDAVSRTATMDRPTVAFSPGQPRTFRVLITEGDPDTDGEHMHLRGVLDAPEVYTVTETGVPPLASIPAIFATGLPVVQKLSATAYQRHASLVLQAGWEPAQFAVTYGAEISADGGLTWLPAYAGDHTTFEATISGATSVKVRVRGFNAALTPGPYTVTGDIAVPALVISGQFANLLVELDDVSQHVKDILVGAPSVVGSIAAAKAAGDAANTAAAAAFSRGDAAFAEAQRQGSAALAAAATAQARGDQAFTNAAAAQTRGDQAFTNAATAQARGDLAFTQALAASDAATTRFAEMRLALTARPEDRVAVTEPTLRALREDLDFLTSSMADMQGRMQTAHTALTEAGLEIVNAEGKARIYGLSELRDSTTTRISNVQVSINAVRGQVELLASIGSTGDLSGLISSITAVRVRLDAVEASLQLYVTTAVFTPLAGRVSTAEGRLDAHDASIALRATTADVNALTTRVSSAEIDISAQRGQITSAVTDLHSATAGTDFTIDSINLLLDNLDRRAGLISQDLAKASQTLGARVLDNGDSIAQLGVNLIALTTTTAARFTDEITARASADTAETTARQALSAIVTDPATGLAQTRADLITEQSTRASGDAANASSISGLAAQVNDGATGLSKTRADLITEQSTRASGDAANASSISTLSAQVNDGALGLPATRARLITEEGTRATADTALSTRTTSLESEVTAARQGEANVSARLVIINEARATADAALSSSITALSSQVNDTTTGLPATRSRLITEEGTRATADTANANAISSLSAQVNDGATGLPKTRADLIAEQSTRASADSANASAISGLASEVHDTTTGLPATRARLITEEGTRATADSALSTRTTALESEVTAARQGEANVSARLVIINEARATADAALSSSISALSAQVNDTSTGLPKTRADLVAEQSTRANADAANASSISGLSAQVNDTSVGLPATRARLITEEGTRANADTALSTRTTSLESEVGAARQGEANVSARLVIINEARATADAALSSSITALSSQVNDSVTGLPATRSRLVTEEGTRATADTANANRTTALETEVTDARRGAQTLNARVIDIYNVMASGDAANASSISALSAAINDATTGLPATRSRIVTEEGTRANADSALSTRTTALESEVTAARQGEANVSARLVILNDARASGDAANASSIATLSSQVNDGTTGLSATRSRLITEENTRATAVSGVSSRTTLLETEVTDARRGASTLNARIVDVYSTIASGDSANASSISSLTTTVNGHTSSLTTVSSSIDGVKLKYGVLGTINGTTGGFLFSGITRLDGGVTYQLELDGNLLVNGSVKARHLAVETLITNSLQIGSQVIDATRLAQNSVTKWEYQNWPNAVVLASGAGVSSGLLGTITIVLEGDSLVRFAFTGNVTNVGAFNYATTFYLTCRIDGNDQGRMMEQNSAGTTVMGSGKGLSMIYETIVQGAGSHTFQLRWGYNATYVNAYARLEAGAELIISVIRK